MPTSPSTSTERCDGHHAAVLIEQRRLAFRAYGERGRDVNARGSQVQSRPRIGSRHCGRCGVCSPMPFRLSWSRRRCVGICGSYRHASSVAALRNQVALTENGAQHPGQVGAFKLVAWEHVWLNKTLREAAVVDGNHQAREHVEIDLGLAAGPSQAAAILGPSMATADRLPRSMPAQPVVMSLNPIEVPHRRQELRGGDNYPCVPRTAAHSTDVAVVQS
jgi:hypothetical protein